jgi:hypothetical protein
MANGQNNNQQEVVVDLKANATAFNQTIQEAQENLAGLGKTPISSNSIKTLKQQLKEANNEAQKIGQTLGTNNQTYADAIRKVADLKDKTQEYNATVAAFNPDNKMSAFIGIAKGAVGAVQGVSGAMAVLGVNAETANETIAKLQGLMAMTDALNSLGDLKDSWKGYILTLSKATVAQEGQVVATKGATLATKGLGMAFKAIGIGLIVAAIAYLVSNFDSLKKSVSTLIPGIDKAGDTFNKVKSTIVGIGGAVIQFAITPIKTLIHLLQGEFKAAVNDMKNGVDVVNNFNKAKAKSQQEQLAESSREKFKKLAEDDAKELEVLKARGENTVALERKIFKNRIASEIEGSEEQKKVKQEQRVFEASEIKKKHDEDKASSDKALAASKAANEKSAAIRKTNLEEIKKDEEEALKTIRQNNLNARAKELDDAQSDFEKKKKAYEKYGQSTANLTTAFNVQKLAINKKYDDLINQSIIDAENKNLDTYEAKKNEINKKIDELLKNATDAQKAMLEASRASQLDGVKKEENLNSVSVNAEINVTKTESENVISDRDTPEQIATKMAAIAEAKATAEQAAYELKKQQLQGQNSELLKLEADHQANLLDTTRNRVENEKALDDAQYAYKVDTLNKVGNAVGALGDLIGQETVAGKALAIAQATINTFVGATEVLRAKTTIPEPWGTVAKIASMTSVIATGLITVKKIASIKVDSKKGGGSGGGGSVSAPNLSNATAPVVSAASLNQNQQVQDVRVTNSGDTVVKAYLSDKDLKDNEARTNFFNKTQNW